MFLDSNLFTLPKSSGFLEIFFRKHWKPSEIYLKHFKGVLEDGLRFPKIKCLAFLGEN